MADLSELLGEYIIDNQDKLKQAKQLLKEAYELLQLDKECYKICSRIDEFLKEE